MNQTISNPIGQWLTDCEKPTFERLKNQLESLDYDFGQVIKNYQQYEEAGIMAGPFFVQINKIPENNELVDYVYQNQKTLPMDVKLVEVNNTETSKVNAIRLIYSPVESN